MEVIIDIDKDLYDNIINYNMNTIAHTDNGRRLMCIFKSAVEIPAGIKDMINEVRKDDYERGYEAGRKAIEMAYYEGYFPVRRSF